MTSLIKLAHTCPSSPYCFFICLHGPHHLNIIKGSNSGRQPSQQVALLSHLTSPHSYILQPPGGCKALLYHKSPSQLSLLPFLPLREGHVFTPCVYRWERKDRLEAHSHSQTPSTWTTSCKGDSSLGSPCLEDLRNMASESRGKLRSCSDGLARPQEGAPAGEQACEGETGVNVHPLVSSLPLSLQQPWGSICSSSHHAFPHLWGPGGRQWKPFEAL